MKDTHWRKKYWRMARDPHGNLLKISVYRIGQGKYWYYKAGHDRVIGPWESAQEAMQACEFNLLQRGWRL